MNSDISRQFWIRYDKDRLRSFLTENDVMCVLEIQSGQKGQLTPDHSPIYIENWFITLMW